MLYWIFLLCFSIFNANSEIIVKGNKLVPSDKIQSLIDQIFDLDEAQETLYASGLFEKIKIYKNNADYIVEVEEKKIISNIVFFVDGDKKSSYDVGLSYDPLIQVTELKAGSIIDEQQIKTAIQKLHHYYNLQNYLNVRINSKIVQQNNIYELQFFIERIDEFEIDEIKFIGLKQLSNISLAKQCISRDKNYLLFSTSSPEPFALPQNLQNILQYARNEGFLKAEIIDTYVEIENIDNSLKQKIYIIFEEGPCFKINKVDLEIDPSLPKLEIFDNLSGVANEYKIREFANKIVKRYKDYGEYVSVYFDQKFDGENVDLSFHVLRVSSKNVVSKIIVKGNTFTRTNIILNAAKITPGSYFDNKKLNQIEDKVMSLGFFKKVDITHQPDKEEGAYIISIKVEEQSTGELGLTGSWQLDSKKSKFLFNLFYQSPNFLGTGNHVLFSITTGQDTDTFNIGYKIHDIFDTNITWFGNAYYTSSSESASFIKTSHINKHSLPIKHLNAKKLENDISSSVGRTLTTIGLTTGLNFDLFSFGSLKINYGIENQKYRHSTFQDENNISRFFKEKHFPRERILHEFTINYGIGKAFNNRQIINFSNNLSFFFDENTSFMKINPTIRSSYPINRSQSIYLSFNAGYGFMKPFSENYYWVDHFSIVPVRGFVELGPVERNRYTHIGGTKKFNASVELVGPTFIPISHITWFAGLYCGSLWGTNMKNDTILKQYADHRQWKHDTLDIGGQDFLFRASAGAGIRFQLGPVKLEWSWNYIFNQDKEVDETQAFQFRLTV